MSKGKRHCGFSPSETATLTRSRVGNPFAIQSRICSPNRGLTTRPTAIYGANQSDHWYWSWWEENRLYDPIVTWKRVKCPTLLIWGGLDDTVPPKTHRVRLSKAGIDNVQEKLFPRGGHVLIEQRTTDLWSDLPYISSHFTGILRGNGRLVA